MSESTAETICTNLGFAPDEAEAAHERVQRRIEHVDEWTSELTTLSLPTGERVHKHQLVVDNDTGDEFMVSSLRDDKIQLLATEMDGSDQQFGERYWLTIGDFIRGAEPQYASDGQPVWAY